MNRTAYTAPATADCDTCNRKVQEVSYDEESGLALCDNCYFNQTGTPVGPIVKTKQVHRSHKACDHAATPAARAKCRKARAAVAAPQEEDVWENLPRDLFNAYEALTDKQREQAAARAAFANLQGATAQARATLSLAAAARAKKTTIAKLSKADVAAALN